MKKSIILFFLFALGACKDKPVDTQQTPACEEIVEQTRAKKIADVARELLPATVGKNLPLSVVGYPYDRDTPFLTSEDVCAIIANKASFVPGKDGLGGETRVLNMPIKKDVSVTQGGRKYSFFQAQDVYTIFQYFNGAQIVVLYTVKGQEKSGDPVTAIIGIRAVEIRTL